MSLETLTLSDLKELGVTELRNRKVGIVDWKNGRAVTVIC